MVHKGMQIPMAMSSMPIFFSRSIQVITIPQRPDKGTCFFALEARVNGKGMGDSVLRGQGLPEAL